MIAEWMAGATLFTLPLGLMAWTLERALRTVGRPARGPWLVALVSAALWPVLAPAVALVSPAAEQAPAVAFPALQSTIDAMARALPPTSDPWRVRLDAALLVLWASMSIGLLIRLFAAWRNLSVVERNASPHVIADVSVLVTPTLGPAVFGVRHPRVLVPRWLLDLDAPLRALVVRHEQEHCRARDPQLTLAAAVLVALVPWNFGAWWIARRLRLALELDCDARVLSHTDGTERYGRLLLLIAQRQAQMTLVPMLAESNSHLTKRITAMNTPRPKNPLGRVAVLGLVAVVALAGSASYALDLTKSGPTAGLSFSNARQEPSGTYYMPKGVTPARPVPGSVELKYPESLKTSRVEGEVLTSFVVDTTGRVDSSSVRVLRSTQEPFTQSALAALTTMRFLPAEMKGRKVRQLVQQAFFFDMKGSAASAARKRPAEGRPTMDSTNTNPMTLRPMVVTAR